MNQRSDDLIVQEIEVFLFDQSDLEICHQCQ